MLAMPKRRELDRNELADAERLREAWEKAKPVLGLSQEQVAFQCGWKTQGAFSQYLLGRVPLNLDALLKISRVLQADPRKISPRLTKLLGAQKTYVDNGQELPLASVPIVGNTQAGPDKVWVEMGYPVGYGDEYLDVPSKDPRAYALRVRGASMAPRMREGEAILVEPSGEAQPGDEVVVKIISSGAVMVKVLVSLRDDQVTLDSIASDFDRMVIPMKDVEYMHVVAGVFRAGRVRKRTPF